MRVKRMRLQVRKRAIESERKTSRDTGGKKTKERREIKKDGGVRQEWEVDGKGQ